MANKFPSDSKGTVEWLSERANRHDGRLTDLEIYKLGKVWIGPRLLAGIYTWQNAFDDAGDPFFPFEYRLFDKDHIQVRGAISDGGTTGTVGFTFLPPFWPVKDISIWGDIVVAGVVQLAVIRVNHVNGQATINF